MTEEETVSARKIGSFAFWIFVIVCANFGYGQYMLYRSIPFAIDLIGHFTVYQGLIESPINFAGFLVAVASLFLTAAFGLVSTLPTINKLPRKTTLSMPL